MKNLSVAVVALSALTVAQPSYAAHFNPRHTDNGGPLGLGNLFVGCCGDTEASSSILNVPGKGIGVALQVLQPTSCTLGFSETGITNVSGGQLFKAIRFTMTGLNSDPTPVANFGVNVAWYDPRGTARAAVFTVANGGLVRNGNNFTLPTGGRNGIAPGSTLREVDFELSANGATTKQTAFIQNVFVDKTLVHYELDSTSAFCGGCA